MKKLALKNHFKNDIPNVEELIMAFSGSPQKFTILTSYKNQIKSAIEEFEDLGSMKHKQTLHNCRQSLRDKINNCYSQPTKDAKVLISKMHEVIEEYDRAKCSYCGINEDAELDHYLPKSKFPYLCLYPMNLVPICGVCNKKKGTKYVHAGKKMFLYPPLDGYIDNQCLRAEIQIVGRSAKVKFYVDCHTLFLNHQYETIKLHFKTLSLPKRYMDQAVSYIARFRADCEKFNLSIEQKRKKLRQTLNVAMADEHPNHWKIATLNSLSNLLEVL